MIPILLFFGLCFFGLGDCDSKESESTDRDEWIVTKSWYQVNQIEVNATVSYCESGYYENSRFHSIGFACKEAHFPTHLVIV